MKRKNTNAPGILPALRRTAAYLKKSLPLIIVALVLAMLGTALTIVGPGQIGKIAALISSGLDGTIDLAAIARIGVLLVIVYLFSALCTFMQHYLMADVTLKMSYQMRGELSRKINVVPQK